jgi:hypothetical protein
LAGDYLEAGLRWDSAAQIQYPWRQMESISVQVVHDDLNIFAIACPGLHI